jgi:hypothetical protein
MCGGLGVAVGYGVEIILAGRMTLIAAPPLRGDQQLRAPSIGCSCRAAPLHVMSRVCSVGDMSCCDFDFVHGMQTHIGIYIQIRTIAYGTPDEREVRRRLLVWPGTQVASGQTHYPSLHVTAGLRLGGGRASCEL